MELVQIVQTNKAIYLIFRVSETQDQSICGPKFKTHDHLVTL